jgi:hypothetical protein
MTAATEPSARVPRTSSRSQRKLGRSALRSRSAGFQTGRCATADAVGGKASQRKTTDAGYPHSIDAHVQERFTRKDHNDLELTLTVDDPKFYAKPFSLGTEYFRWVPDQVLDERLCIPSNVIEYLKAVGDPAGKQP